MDGEEGLIKLIYTKDELQSLQYSGNDVQQYLQQLGSCGLNKLSKEPERIQEERASIISQTQELAFQNYPTFIETASCTQEILSDFKTVNIGAGKLTTNLNTLKEKCMDFSKTAQSLSTARRLTSLALSRHTQLLEILELPQLMDTCVRNGYWEEALELSSHVVRLERKLGYIPLIVNIAREVQSCTRLMLSQLIAQLRMPIELGHCIKVVGYLRRVGVFSEEELRLKFLQARDSWSRSTLEEIPKDDAFHHAMKTIDLNRDHMHKIASQYRTIFNDEDPIVLANQDSNINDSAMFYSWIIQKVSDFLTALQADLNRIPSSSLEKVMVYSMYFGQSCGHIGSDFRALLVPLFAQVVYDRFDQSTNKSEAQFADDMASFSLLRTSSASQSALPMASGNDQIEPPQSLLKFTPLAVLCNGIVSALDELRLCAPVHLVVPVVRKLQLTLGSCSQVMADFHRHEKEVMTANEKQQFAKCLELYHQDFLDYLQKILHIMFPVSQLSQQTGFTNAQVQKQGLVTLDRQSIVRPLSHLLVIPTAPTVMDSLPETAGIVPSSLDETVAPEEIVEVAPEISTQVETEDRPAILETIQPVEGAADSTVETPSETPVLTDCFPEASKPVPDPQEEVSPLEVTSQVETDGTAADVVIQSAEEASPVVDAIPDQVENLTTETSPNLDTEIPPLEISSLPEQVENLTTEPSPNLNTEALEISSPAEQVENLTTESSPNLNTEAPALEISSLEADAMEPVSSHEVDKLENLEA